MAEVTFRVTLFPERIQREINNPSGGTSRAVEQTARFIVDAAKQFIGEKYSGHHPEREKRLRDSGVVEHNGGSSWSAVYRHPIALIHHEGAKAHTMPRKSPREAKPFYVRRGPGGYTFGPRRGPISHPGHKGNPYLVKAAQQVARGSGALKRGSAGPFPIFRLPGGGA